MVPTHPVDLQSQPHHRHRIMPAPIHYLNALESYMDETGTVCYWYAKVCADLCKIPEAFSTEYGHMEGERIDLGEFNVWALNLL